MLKGSRFPESQAMGPRIRAEGYLLIPILRPFGPAVGGKRCCQFLEPACLIGPEFLNDDARPPTYALDLD